MARNLFLPRLLSLAVVVLTLLPAPCRSQTKPGATADKSAPQIWYGVMNVEDVRQFRFVVQLSREQELLQGQLTSLDEGGTQFELRDVKQTDEKLEFTLPRTKATYVGETAADGQTIQGAWKQNGREFALNFRAVESAPARPATKVWKGTLNAIVQKLDVAFVHLEDGTIVFDSISQKGGGFIVDDASTDDEVIYKVPAVRGTFKGKMSEDGKTLAGRWSQGLASLKLELHRSSLDSLVREKPNRPQTPQGPFPYDIQEVTFDSLADGVKLAGTLTVPRGNIRAGVVLISGSGPQDRDESLLEHKPFWVIADHFARHGIATLRYDDRGTAASTGDFASATSFDFADDAEAAMNFLRSQSRLAELPIGLCGHSEGGLIAPMIAARNEQTDFIILMAGPGVNGRRIVQSQTRLIAEAEGQSEEDILRDERVQQALLAAVVDRSDVPDPELAKIIREELKDIPEVDQDMLDEQIRAGVEQLTRPWMKAFLRYEPAETLAKVSCPVLVIIGEKDLQVDPKLNLPPIREALRRGGNQAVEIIEYPGLNHLFQTCRTGSVSEYQGIEETFNEEPLRKMSSWISRLSK